MCCHIVKEVCEALEYAHMKRNEVGEPLALIHRDVSPQNILISYEGEVKLIDFGIAKAAGKANKTKSGILKGKFGYMSPEQVRVNPLTAARTFLASPLCYTSCYARTLFQGSDDFSTLRASPQGRFQEANPAESRDSTGARTDYLSRANSESRRPIPICS